ncbi:selenium metabolism-associated LysR family transcriptional regulator [Fundidesulfovibrio butyratiphilus]
MDIRRLEAFTKVYELGSFSKAGQELLLSQPTISAHVISLEQELGVQLFDRLGRSILATQAGEILYRHTQEAFTALEQARSEINLLLERVAGELIIGASTIPATYLLPALIGQFLRKHKEVRLQLRGGDSQEILTAVLSGQIAMGVVGAVNEEPELLFQKFAQDRLQIVASPAFAVKVRESASSSGPLPLEHIVKWPWVMREPGSGTRKAFESALTGAGFDIRRLNVCVQAQTPETLLHCVAHGVGLCSISSFAAEQSLRDGDLVSLDVEGLDIVRNFYAVRHAKRHVFPVLRYFLDHLNANKLQPREEP